MSHSNSAASLESLLECTELVSAAVWTPLRLPVLGQQTLVPLAWRIAAPASGPHTVVLGGIHGNELCGVHAVRSLLEKFSSHAYTLSAGTLTVALGNAEAIRVGKRYVGANLNRQFRDEYTPQGSEYERRRVQELMAVLSDNVDFLLDLHATSAPSRPYAMIERRSLPATQIFGFERIVSGWAELGDSSLAGDTQSFIESRGGCAITMENGQLADPHSTQSALETCDRVLVHRGVTGLAPVATHKSEIFHMTAVQPLVRAGFTYARQFENLEPLSRGELIGKDSVQEYVAPTDYDPFMILPANPKNLKIGENLFHFGCKVVAV